MMKFMTAAHHCYCESMLILPMVLGAVLTDHLNTSNAVNADQLVAQLDEAGAVFATVPLTDEELKAIGANVAPYFAERP